jgi:hypothetical protein
LPAGRRRGRGRRCIREIRRIAYLPSYVMTCDEQMMRIRDAFLDYGHPVAADDA